MEEILMCFPLPVLERCNLRIPPRDEEGGNVRTPAKERVRQPAYEIYFNFDLLAGRHRMIEGQASQTSICRVVVVGLDKFKPRCHILCSDAKARHAHLASLFHPAPPDAEPFLQIHCAHEGRSRVGKGIQRQKKPQLGGSGTCRVVPAKHLVAVNSARYRVKPCRNPVARDRWGDCSHGLNAGLHRVEENEKGDERHHCRVRNREEPVTPPGGTHRSCVHEVVGYLTQTTPPVQSLRLLPGPSFRAPPSVTSTYAVHHEAACALAVTVIDVERRSWFVWAQPTATHGGGRTASLLCPWTGAGQSREYALN